MLEKIEKVIAGIIAAIEDGMYQPSMKARMDELERQKAEIIARQMKAPTDPPAPSGAKRSHPQCRQPGLSPDRASVIASVRSRSSRASKSARSLPICAQSRTPILRMRPISLTSLFQAASQASRMSSYVSNTRLDR